MNAPEPLLADAVLKRAAWRLIPFMSLMYVVSFLDRVNISFAALTMNHDLGFSPKAYGIAAGIFFWGYFLFEVPSNLMLQKVGARLWMCRICVTWGLLSMAQAFVKDPISFSIVRFLLGAAEAGLYPGMVLYMTYWFPSSTRARFIALFLGGVPLSVVIGGPISGFLLGVSGYGLHGWQWMLILEGVPSLLCGVVTLWIAGWSGQGKLAQRGRERDHRRAACGRPSQRYQAGRAARLQGDLAGSAYLAVDDPGFFDRHRTLWPESLAAADGQGAGLFQSPDRLHRGTALSSGGGGDGGAGRFQRPQRRARRPRRLRRLCRHGRDAGRRLVFLSRPDHPVFMRGVLRHL